MAILSRRERELLAVIECQGDDVDVAEAATDLGISQNTLKTRVKAIRAKLAAPSSTYWLEHLPGRAREFGEQIAPCVPEMPDDGRTRVET